MTIYKPIDQCRNERFPDVHELAKFWDIVKALMPVTSIHLCNRLAGVPLLEQSLLSRSTTFDRHGQGHISSFARIGRCGASYSHHVKHMALGGLHEADHG